MPWNDRRERKGIVNPALRASARTRWDCRLGRCCHARFLIRLKITISILATLGISFCMQAVHSDARFCPLIDCFEQRTVLQSIFALKRNEVVLKGYYQPRSPCKNLRRFTTLVLHTHLSDWMLVSSLSLVVFLPLCVSCYNNAYGLHISLSASFPIDELRQPSCWLISCSINYYARSYMPTIHSLLSQSSASTRYPIYDYLSFVHACIWHNRTILPSFQ